MIHAHEDSNIASVLQEVVNEQQPISHNYAHPMKHSRKWGSVTPKLETASDARKRHDRRVSRIVPQLSVADTPDAPFQQASVTFTATETATSSAATATPTTGTVDTSVYKAGLAWTSGSGSYLSDFLPDSSSTVAKRGGARLSKRLGGSVIGW